MTATAERNGDQRARILDRALELMAAGGSAAVSMRQLATACDLNVATLYHYFPSKADLLRSLLEDRQYHQMLEVGFVLDADLPPAQRLASMLDQIFAGALAEEAVWRLVIGESLRSEQPAVDSVTALIDHLRRALTTWLERDFPELAMPAADAAHVLSGQVFGFFIEVLVAPPEHPPTYLSARAHEIARTIFQET